MISLSVVILPLTHPVRLAEDIAVLHHLSGGRLEVVLGSGARAEEFAGYGVSLGDRAAMMDEGVTILRGLLTGETVTVEGRFWNLSNARITPEIAGPFSLLLGGATRAAARRAARFSDGFVAATPASLEIWREEMRALGRDPRDADGRSMTPPIGPRNFLHVAHVPDEAWELIAPHAVHESSTYASWAGGGRASVYAAASDADSLRAGGTYAVLTPSQTVALGHELYQHDHRRMILHPMMGGLDPKIGMDSLELVVSEVMGPLAISHPNSVAPAP